jgi:hypothetical protein
MDNQRIIKVIEDLIQLAVEYADGEGFDAYINPEVRNAEQLLSELKPKPPINLLIKAFQDGQASVNTQHGEFTQTASEWLKENGIAKENG